MANILVSMWVILFESVDDERGNISEKITLYNNINGSRLALYEGMKM